MARCDAVQMRCALLAGLLAVTAVSAAEAQPTFLVFFDWDRATLNAQGRQSVYQAAAVALRTGSPVYVNGFADTSGPSGYNNALSWRRVQTVVAELERDGIPPGAVHTQGFGEAYLPLPTPDEVREPQNRRVQITVQQPIVMAPPPVRYPYPYPVTWPLWPFGSIGVGIGWGGWGGFHGGWGGHGHH